MADDLKRVGLVFKADGSVDFQKSLKEINSSIQENRTALKLAESQYDSSTKATDKLADRQKYLVSQTKDYGDKVKVLEAQLKDLESAEKRDENAINKKKSQLNQAKTSLNNYKKGLQEVENQLTSGSSKIEEYSKKIDDFSEKSKNVGDKLSGVSTAAAGLLAGAAAMVPATEEYRKIMASLEASSEMAGYTAEQTKQSYTTLFGVLGDDQTAATTTANLQAMGLSQDQLNQLINGTIGAWAKYGDSIPIDGLAEAINETVKVGTVTGTFADVLNWAGTSEDNFNAKLQACSSESERANLIMQELANQGLMQAGQKWQENNQNLVEGNQATLEMKNATAELAETIAPIITSLTDILAGLLGKFNELPTSVQATIGVVLLLVAASSSLFNIIGTVSTGVGAFTKILGFATTGAKALWAVMAANPVGAVITVVGLLTAGLVTLYNKCEWFRNGVNNVFNGIKNFIGGIVDWLKGIFNFEWSLPKIKLPHFSLTGSFSLVPPSVPRLSVSWYAKGGILTKPTIFGANGTSLLAGGEAGPEAVLPISALRQYIRDENRINNSVLAEMIKEALKELQIYAENNIYIGDKKLYQIITEMVIAKIGEYRLGNKKVTGGA